MPFGAYSLWPASESRSTPSSSTVAQTLPTDCAASVCIAIPHSREGRDLLDRLERPDLVVGVHDADQDGAGLDRAADLIGIHQARLAYGCDREPMAVTALE